MYMQAAEAAKAAAQAGEGEDGETVDGSLEKEEDHVGVPHIIIDVIDKQVPVSVKVADTGKLPSVEEVSLCPSFVNPFPNNPWFYVSAEQVFRKHCGKRKNCL